MRIRVILGRIPYSLQGEQRLLTVFGSSNCRSGGCIIHSPKARSLGFVDLVAAGDLWDRLRPPAISLLRFVWIASAYGTDSPLTLVPQHTIETSFKHWIAIGKQMRSRTLADHPGEYWVSTR